LCTTSRNLVAHDSSTGLTCAPFVAAVNRCALLQVFEPSPDSIGWRGGC
jgi:hypothetical protein